MKKLSFSICAMLLVLNVAAQKKDLVVRTSDKGMFLDHKVTPRESFFSVGRLYNVSPKLIATFNKLELNKGLLIDQKLRIPLTDTNFTQEGNSGTPVYYKIGDKETLAEAGSKFNNVPLTRLQQWNNISGESVKGGTRLIIGFLKSNEFPSVTINNPVPEKVEEKVSAEEKIVPEEKTATTEIKDEGEVKVTSENTNPAKQEENNDVKSAVMIEENPVTGSQGYFKSHFDLQVRIIPATKNETVTAGVFKTASGWQDAKYYLLIDKVPPGTIIRVINPTNNKSIYAKVLGEMSGIRQNEGLNIRISNAAADALEITETDKFIVNINY
jgi:hypothetical protein